MSNLLLNYKYDCFKFITVNIFFLNKYVLVTVGESIHSLPNSLESSYSFLVEHDSHISS